MTEPTFTIIACEDHAAIKCFRCGMVSHNPNDVANRYCGNCHIFHEDVDIQEHFNELINLIGYGYEKQSDV